MIGFGMFDAVESSTLWAGSGNIFLLGAAAGKTDFALAYADQAQLIVIVRAVNHAHWAILSATYNAANDSLTPGTVIDSSAGPGQQPAWLTGPKAVHPDLPQWMLSRIAARLGVTLPSSSSSSASPAPSSSSPSSGSPNSSGGPGSSSPSSSSAAPSSSSSSGSSH